MKHQRHILLPNVHNLRDLGGYPASDGKITKWGLLYRTDSLSELTKEGWKGLRDLGVCCIIDLRSAKEREQMPVVPLYPLSCMAFSLMGDSEYGPAPTPALEDEEDMGTGKPEADNAVSDAAGNGEKDATDEFLRSMRLNYPATLFTNIKCAVDILDAVLSVLSSGEGSIAYMCSAGKDRTGIVSALILYLCGVPDEDIVADYMVSNVYNTGGVNIRLKGMVRGLLGRDPDEDFLRSNLGSDPETMRALLDSFRKRDIEKTLADNGFGKEKQIRLRELMTE